MVIRGSGYPYYLQKYIKLWKNDKIISILLDFFFTPGKLILYNNLKIEPRVVARDFNPSAQEARLADLCEFEFQPRLHSETFSGGKKWNKKVPFLIIAAENSLQE